MVSVGASTGSTPTTRTDPAHQAAVPPMSPPPPTATRIVVTSGHCAISSIASVPWPSSVSRWSNACTGSAPERAVHAWLATSASS